MSRNLVLYLTAILIWGSTWYAIELQLGVVDPKVSVAYRFALAGTLLMAWQAVRRERLWLPRGAWRWVGLTALLTFSFNYLLTYKATGYLPSGLVAVGSSVMSLMNVLNARIFLGKPIGRGILAGGMMGVAGIVLLFLPEFQAHGLDGAAGIGFALVLVGAYSASLGNMAVSKTRGAGVPLLPATGWGMLLGALVMALLALADGAAFTFDWTPAYAGSLIYLAVFGSVVTFLSYFALIGRIGPERAGYVAVMTPVLALVISTFFEDFHWTAPGAFGLALAIGGNLLVMAPPRASVRPRQVPVATTAAE